MLALMLIRLAFLPLAKQMGIPTLYRIIQKPAYTSMLPQLAVALPVFFPGKLGGSG
jgi:hypothetical protein